MDIPRLYRVRSTSVKNSGKAIIIIPGLCSEDSDIGERYSEAVYAAGWDGEVYHLWWDSSSWESIVSKYVIPAVIFKPILTPVTLAYKMRLIRKHAKKSGRDYLRVFVNKRLQGKRITFVAHSLGAYMVYKMFKKTAEYPIDNSLDDLILLGGAVSRKKDKWRRTKFKTLYNVFNENDSLLYGWKYLSRPGQLKMPVSPCGRSAIEKECVSNTVNIDVSSLVKTSHTEYEKVFITGMLSYKYGYWTVR